jgi:hypothetical protein
VGNIFGKIATVDFVLSHRFALVLFETNTQAVMLNMTKTEMNQIPNPKFSDRRGFAQCPSSKYFALLTRSGGQDQVMVFKPSEKPSSFSPKTSDAQSLQWSPNSDPVLVIADSAAYGVKVVFFTALGHSLKQLDISSLNAIPSEGIGVVMLRWYAVGSSTVLALADGSKAVLVRKQESQTMVNPAFPNQFFVLTLVVVQANRCFHAS